jgi:hypothetical protein
MVWGRQGSSLSRVLVDRRVRIVARSTMEGRSLARSLASRLRLSRVLGVKLLLLHFSSPHTERHTAVDSLWNSGKIAKANDPKAKLMCSVAIRKHLGEDFKLRAPERDA